MPVGWGGQTVKDPPDVCLSSLSIVGHGRDCLVQIRDEKGWCSETLLLGVVNWNLVLGMSFPLETIVLGMYIVMYIDLE